MSIPRLSLHRRMPGGREVCQRVGGFGYSGGMDFHFDRLVFSLEFGMTHYINNNVSAFGREILHGGQLKGAVGLDLDFKIPTTIYGLAEFNLGGLKIKKCSDGYW